MGYYSFKVRSDAEVDLPQHLVTIGVGVDVFSTQVDDLDGFLRVLTQEGVIVLETHRLDDHVAIEPINEAKLLLGNTTLLTGATMSDRVFAGQRTTTYTQAKNEVLKVFFHKHALYPVVIAGRVAAHLKCGLIEAENLLERMVADGSIQHATPELLKFAGVRFGYAAAVSEAIAS